MHRHFKHKVARFFHDSVYSTGSPTSATSTCSASQVVFYVVKPWNASSTYMTEEPSLLVRVDSRAATPNFPWLPCIPWSTYTCSTSDVNILASLDYFSSCALDTYAR